MRQSAVVAYSAVRVKDMRNVHRAIAQLLGADFAVAHIPLGACSSVGYRVGWATAVWLMTAIPTPEKLMVTTG